MPWVRGPPPTRSWKPTREVREARSAEQFPGIDFTKFAVLLTVADTCRGDSRRTELARPSGQAPRSGEQSTRLGLNPIPAFGGTRGSDGSAHRLPACGSAQRGIYRVHVKYINVNNLAEPTPIEIGSAISVSAH
jgi:hypothetical protein